MQRLASPYTPQRDRLLRIVGPLVLYIIGFMFFRLKFFLDTPRSFLFTRTCIGLFSGYIGWELSRFTALYIQQRLPGLQRISSRLVYLVISTFVIAHFGFLLRRVIHIAIGYPMPLWPDLLDYSGGVGVILYHATITLGLYEGGYLWQQWKKALVEKEALVQLEWEARYNVLKAQINPHFLFNSLNSLSSLIHENPQQATRFTDEMSKVYRYLLQNNSEELVTLDKELLFARSYGHLLATRFGSSFQMQIEVDNELRHCLLPSLTLQLLLENAVKHNVALKEKPLYVRIYTNDQAKLVVENNLQQRAVVVQSNNVGLKNINAKFELLIREGIGVQKTDSHFIVTIPLIGAKAGSLLMEDAKV